MVFKKENMEAGFRTTYGSKLNVEEEKNMLVSGSCFLFATIPLMA